MSKILILGGYGYTGKFLARHLLAQTDVEIIISGRNLEKAKSFADELTQIARDCKTSGRIQLQQPCNKRFKA